MEIELDDSINPQEVLDRSIQLLKNVFDDKQKFRSSPAQNFQSKAFNRSRMEGVMQSTRLLHHDTSSPYSDADISLTLMPGELNKINEWKSFHSGKFINPAAQTAQDSLFTDFMESWQRTLTNDQDIFSCILEYIEYCSTAITLIRGSEDHALARLSALDERRLGEIDSEKNTWKLIYTLYRDRLLSHEELEGGSDVDMVQLDLDNASEKEIMERLFKRDSNVREWQCVIDWLEGTASEKATGPGVERYTDKAVMWENTLHERQNVNGVAYKSSRELVTQVDPDAPRRQNKHLHDLDQEDEDRLEAVVIREVRCGRLDDAQAQCVHAGQPMRAALFEGWKLYHDPNYATVHNPVSREVLPVEGNPHRDIWKWCAWNMCEDTKMPLKARAAVAAYCGHLPSLLSWATTWEDYLWSYLKVQVDIYVEREIRQCSMKTYVDMPDSYWNHKMSIETVFNEISANKDKSVRNEALNPDHVVQKTIILDAVPQLIEHLPKWISGSDMSVGTDSESVSSHFMRFLAHFVLFLRHVGSVGVDAIGDAVIEAYVKLLIERRDIPLVAWYVSQLSPEDQIYFYSAFLEEIYEEEERAAALKVAVEAGLNVELITKTVVENIRQQPCNVDSVSGLESQDVSPEDNIKINSLEWLKFYPSQRSELLVQANALIAYFLASGNVFAARTAFSKVPEATVALIRADLSGMGEDTYLNMAMENMPKHIALAINEYQCYKAYLEADDSFSDWFQHFHHAKPEEPKLQPGYTFIEKIGHDHRVTQYKADLLRWKTTMEAQTETTKKMLFNVVTWPGGWLVDIEPEEPDRTEQLNAMRSIIIPKVTNLLHLVMSSMQDHATCVALADLIADPQGQLYKVFTKQRLQDLLAKITESSVALLNEGKDPWGFSIN